MVMMVVPGALFAQVAVDSITLFIDNADAFPEFAFYYVEGEEKHERWHRVVAGEPVVPPVIGWSGDRFVAVPQHLLDEQGEPAPEWLRDPKLGIRSVGGNFERNIKWTVGTGETRPWNDEFHYRLEGTGDAFTLTPALSPLRRKLLVFGCVLVAVLAVAMFFRFRSRAPRPDNPRDSTR
jgi:hypothetical protein